VLIYVRLGRCSDKPTFVQGMCTIPIGGFGELLGWGGVEWYFSYVYAGYDSCCNNAEQMREYRNYKHFMSRGHETYTQEDV